VKLPVLIAADGAIWEAALVLALDAAEHGVTVVRRCVDVVDVLAVAGSGQVQAALLAAELPRLDPDAIDRLIAAGVMPVGVIARGDDPAEVRLRTIGVAHVVASDADPKVIASILEQAVASGPAGSTGLAGLAGVAGVDWPTGAATTRSGQTRGFSTTGALTANVTKAPADIGDEPVRRGAVVAVWGPAGAPGRTTVAVALADELARLGQASLLIDADVYGGVIAAALGLLDESAGLAAACRQAAATRLDPAGLAPICWQVRSNLRVLTGIPRAERWPELRPSALSSVLSAGRGLADFVVVDCGFCLESDEELSFDTAAPRRNGATLAILDAADLIIIVGAADPIGLQRLARGLTELGDAEITATSWVVLNRVRGAVVPGDLGVELGQALQRFTGRAAAALLPLDQDAVDVATAEGKTLAEARPGSPLRRSLVELAAAVAGVEVPRRRHRRR
jgi:MinD-like ATPase involved in chromosome partitioning or flagellar assembly